MKVFGRWIGSWVFAIYITFFPPKDCQMKCDTDCEVGHSIHCWNWHRPRHKPDWHDPRVCDARLRNRRQR